MFLLKLFSYICRNFNLKQRKVMKKIVTFCFLAAILLTSCQTKQSAISDLRTLNQEIRLNADNYSINDWSKVGKRYYDINKNITKHAGDYTDAEMQEISNLNGQCLRSFTTGAITKVNGAASMLRSLLEGFLK